MIGIIVRAATRLHARGLARLDRRFDVTAKRISHRPAHLSPRSPYGLRGGGRENAAKRGRTAVGQWRCYCDAVSMPEPQLKDRPDEDAVERYRTIIDIRNLEIRLFWQRSNYFLVLNTALGTGLFVVRGHGFAVLLSLLGLTSALLWLCVNLGGKFWQVRWEQRLHDEERG